MEVVISSPSLTVTAKQQTMADAQTRERNLSTPLRKLIKPQKDEKRGRAKQPEKKEQHGSKYIPIDSYFKCNGLNCTKEREAEYIKQQDPSMCCL